MTHEEHKKADMRRIRNLLTRYERQSNCHCGHEELIYKMMDTRFTLELAIEEAINDAYRIGMRNGSETNPN